MLPTVQFFAASWLLATCVAAPSPMWGEEEFKIDLQAVKKCEESGDCQVFGDVVIPTRSVVALTGVVDYSWPDGVLPYYIKESTFTHQRYIDLVHQAADQLSNQTCVTIRPRKPSDDTFLTIRMVGSGCSANPLGYRPGRSHEIRLAAGCFNVGTGTVMHEFIHILGFYHEQSRDDRDAYVQVNWENMSKDPGVVYQFRKASEDGFDVSYFGVKYNYESIMHYPPWAFTANGRDTITSLDNPDAIGRPSQMGQRSRLTSGDVQMINGKYGDSSKCKRHTA